MPTSKSAEKDVRVSGRRRLRNKSIRSQVKTSITRAEGLIFSGQLEAAREAVTAAVSSLDRAAGSILKANSSARRKSRLMKKLNQALAVAETKKAG